MCNNFGKKVTLVERKSYGISSDSLILLHERRPITCMPWPHLRSLNNVEQIANSIPQSAWIVAESRIKRFLSVFDSWKPLCWLAGLCLAGLLGVVQAAEPMISTRANVGEVTIQYAADAAPEWHTDQLARIVPADIRLRKHVFHVQAACVTRLVNVGYPPLK